MKKCLIIVLNTFTNDSRVLKESKTLAANGYDVEVVALHKEQLSEKETIQNIPVHRIKLKTISRSKRKVVKVINYIEFVFKVIRQYRKRDIFHCNDLSALPIGVIVKLFFNRNARVVYDAHEYETETNGLKGIEKKLRAWLERSLIKYADKVITVSDSIANEYQRLYSIQKPDLVLNCPPFAEVKRQDLFRKELGIREDQTIFLYQGGLSSGRGIEILTEAFSKLDSDKNVIVFMGYGPLEEEVKQQARLHKTIYFREAVSPGVLLNYTASADYGILFYENSCLNHYYCSPNKMFEYLMAGIPVLTSNLFEMKRLVEHYGLGVVAAENTVDGFLQAVNTSLVCDYQQIKKNVSSVNKVFNWEAQEEVILRVYNAL